MEKIKNYGITKRLMTKLQIHCCPTSALRRMLIPQRPIRTSPAGPKERIKAMQLEQLSKEVMNLSLEERAELAQRLLVSLDEAPTSEIERLWMQEAERRLKEFREGKVQGIPAEDVFRRAISEIS